MVKCVGLFPSERLRQHSSTQPTDLNFTENLTLVSGYLENDDGVGSTLLGEKQ